MCVLICKYFKNIGWVGVKNRDRGYIPTVTFRHLDKNDNEKLVLWDEDTNYSEGINEHGISVLSTSLMVKDDENEGRKKVQESPQNQSKDGPKIRKTLDGTTLEECLQIAIETKVNGHTAIYNRDKLILLESARDKNEEYDYKFKEIPITETIARTNHGIWLKDAGYQRDPDNIKHYLSRISSETRMLASKYVVDRAENPDEMMNGLICNFDKNEPQLNPMRIDDKKGHMFTTAQLMIIPKKKTLYYRPVRSHIDVDFSNINAPDSKTWFEILSPRLVWKFHKDD